MTTKSIYDYVSPEVHIHCLRPTKCPYFSEKIAPINGKCDTVGDNGWCYNRKVIFISLEQYKIDNGVSILD